MDERRTHYQVSFTPGQGLAVFLVLLGSLGGAYFFGLMTGLSGRDAQPGAAPAVAAAQPTVREDLFPTPVLGIQPGPGRVSALPRGSAGTAGTAPPPSRVQLFDDRGEGEGAPAADAPPPSAPSPATGTAALGGGFWVQVVSLSSEAEARARTARLVRRGYPAVVLPGPGGRGSVFRVRVGPFERREDAARAASRLAAEEKTETWIVPSGR